MIEAVCGSSVTLTTTNFVFFYIVIYVIRHLYLFIHIIIFFLSILEHLSLLFIYIGIIYTGMRILILYNVMKVPKNLLRVLSTYLLIVFLKSFFFNSGR